LEHTPSSGSTPRFAPDALQRSNTSPIKISTRKTNTNTSPTTTPRCDDNEKQPTPDEKEKRDDTKERKENEKDRKDDKDRKEEKRMSVQSSTSTEASHSDDELLKLKHGDTGPRLRTRSLSSKARPKHLSESLRHSTSNSTTLLPLLMGNARSTSSTPSLTHVRSDNASTPTPMSGKFGGERSAERDKDKSREKEREEKDDATSKLSPPTTTGSKKKLSRGEDLGRKECDARRSSSGTKSLVARKMSLTPEQSLALFGFKVCSVFLL
jgi:hypothetical protein